MSCFFEAERFAALQLMTMGLEEDLRDVGDLTSNAMIQPDRTASVAVMVRKPGTVAGIPIGQMVFEALDAEVVWHSHVEDGAKVKAGDTIAVINGRIRSLLTGERTALNFLTHLSGIATLTARFVAAVKGTKAQILDTRKTLPGYRVLQKYAVRCGGGVNHRMGLYDGVLIKDNHLSAWTSRESTPTVASAITEILEKTGRQVPIEVEVDTLEQLVDALDAQPDIVLLDNMLPEQIREAIAIRDGKSPGVLLEASGGVTLETVADIAVTGVDRISIGALTHSAPSLDLAFDWRGAQSQ